MGRMVTRSALISICSYAMDARQLGTLSCQCCRSPLDLHQPNPDRPDQFLGTCSACGRWFRVEAKADEGRICVVLIPEVEEIRSAGVTPAYRRSVE